VRAVLLAIVLAATVGLVACSGDDGESAAPLTMEERLLRASEVPGSKLDPVETRLTADNLDEFTGWQEYVPAAEIDRSELQKAGFVSAVAETRYIPKTPGGAHTRDAAHVRMLVMQFESDEGAADGAELVRKNGLKPCPGDCAMRIEEFEPSGIDDADGIRHFATKEEIEATGGEGVPTDSYTIVFTDGPFVYEVEGFDDPGEISKQQIEEIAQKVRDRVEGAPAEERAAGGY
jgi:hypothetical protein